MPTIHKILILQSTLLLATSCNQGHDGESMNARSGAFLQDGEEKRNSRESEGKATGDNEGLSGYLAEMEQARIRCAFKKNSDKDYQITCQAMVVTDSGKETPVTAMDPEFILNFQIPTLTKGDGRIDSCLVKDFKQLCSIADVNTISEIIFTLKLTHKASTKKYEESDKVLLPARPVVTHLSDSGLGKYRPQINWQPVDTAVTYDVFLARLYGDGTDELIGTYPGVSENKFIPPEALQSGYYRVFVKALNAASHSGWSAHLNFAIDGEFRPPFPPTGLKASNTNSSSPYIQWDDDPSAASYSVYLIRFYPDGAAKAVANVPDLKTNSYTPNDLENGSYRMWVKAANGFGLSGFSQHLDFSITSP